MSNMSCCRFQTTLKYLRDCYEHNDDPYADTRLAIVQAAAAIGEQMP